MVLIREKVNTPYQRLILIFETLEPCQPRSNARGTAPNKKPPPWRGPYLVLSKLGNCQTAFSELLSCAIYMLEAFKNTRHTILGWCQWHQQQFTKRDPAATTGNPHSQMNDNTRTRKAASVGDMPLEANRRRSKPTMPPAKMATLQTMIVSATRYMHQTQWQAIS